MKSICLPELLALLPSGKGQICSQDQDVDEEITGLPLAGKSSTLSWKKIHHTNLADMKVSFSDLSCKRGDKQWR